MGIIECPNCERTSLAPGYDKDQKLCSTCHSKLQHRMNSIDREYTMKDDQKLNNKEYSEKFKRMHDKKVRHIDHMLKDIPPELMPSDLAQMAEEIKDPEITHRTFCIGKLDEIESTKNGVVLRDKYDPHS